jgi:endoglucanase
MKRTGIWLIAYAVFACIAVFFVSCNGDKDTRLSVDKNGKTVVERYGQLQVIGTNLCTGAGEPVQLRGMSSHGLQWYGRYANRDVLKWLRDDWNMQIWRPALYLTEGGYIGSPVLKQKVVDSVDAGIELGLYVLIDWHVLNDHDPRAYQKQSVEFFTEMAQKYGSYPNVIYEICNEPNGKDVTWDGSIKPYAETIIATIRQYDPDNIIIVGTPTWSQDVDIAANNPILNQKNIMYSLHFYAGSHGDALKAKTEAALAKGLPIFVTEWGTTLNTGDQFHPKESLVWLSFLKKHNISWVNWSVNNKGEDSGILAYNADRDGKGGWRETDLSKSGIFVRRILRNETKIR